MERGSLHRAFMWARSWKFVVTILSGALNPQQDFLEREKIKRVTSDRSLLWRSHDCSERRFTCRAAWRQIRYPSWSDFETARPALGKESVDIVGDDTAKVPLGARPRIALLSQIETSTKEQVSDTQNRAWITECLAGTTGIIGAVPYSIGNKTLGDKGFPNLWQQAPKRRRVFLSFTRLEIKEAEK